MSDDVQQPRTPIVQRAGLFVSLCGVGALSALALAPEPQAQAAGAVDVLLAGEPLPPHGDARAQAREFAQREGLAQ